METSRTHPGNSDSIERFVDMVEQDPAIADRMLRAPVRTEVYWEDA